MAGLVPAIHVFVARPSKTWIPGSSPGMTMARASADFLLRHHAECRIGARDDGIVGPYETLRKTDRAAGLDDVGLDREPLPDLGAADKIDCHAHRHQRIGAAHFVA